MKVNQKKPEKKQNLKALEKLLPLSQKNGKNEKKQKEMNNKEKRANSIQNSIKKIQKNNSMITLQKPKINQNIKNRPKSSDNKIEKNKQNQKEEIKKKIQLKDVTDKKHIKQKSKAVQQPPKNMVASQILQQKDMGLIFMKPQFDKVIYENLEITDASYNKYFDMITNDNDTYYVLNSIPEIKQYRKQEDSDKKKSLEPVLTGRLSKISGMFDQLTVEKVLSALKNKPIYFDNKSKVLNCRLVLQTKFKVSVDIGYMQYTIQADKLIILRVYISKIYRKMNYTAFIYLQVMKQLLQKYQNCQRCAIIIHQKNIAVLKFYKFMGFKIQRVLTDTKNQKVDYFQEFVNKKKQFISMYQKINTTTIQ